MRTILAGNWKMHTDGHSAVELARAVAHGAGHGVRVVVAPPFPYLGSVVEAVAGSSVIVAAQNCHAEEKGAFTGEVSVPMLKDLGVKACIVGHSERRQYFNESDAAVHRKIIALLHHGLIPIYCCGETREEREGGRHFDVVAAQLHEALATLPAASVQQVVVAYEPVWAIGTGLTASAGQAQEMHAFIRAELRKLLDTGADLVPILYGGSCKPDNAEALFAGADVDGGLIGGAALASDQFLELVRIAERIKS